MMTERNGVRFQLWLSQHNYLPIEMFDRFTSAMCISLVALDKFWVDTTLQSLLLSNYCYYLPKLQLHLPFQSWL